MFQNSIRHNLSLHNRFMRIQNEGTGKSSWWVINPDAKPGKTPRRRAASMDTKAYEKKRGRAARKVEALRAARESALTSSASSLNEAGDLTLDAFTDFRARTSSNASSIGRLSPIHSALETDSSIPPMSSPLPWGGDNMNSPYNKQDFSNTEHLTESLAEMFVGDQMNALSPESGIGRSTLSTPSPMQSQLSPNSGMQSYGEGGMLRAPPPYSEASGLQQSPQQPRSPQQNLRGMSPLSNNMLSAMDQEPSPPAMLNQSPNNFLGGQSSPTLTELQPMTQPPMYQLPNGHAQQPGHLMDTSPALNNPGGIGSISGYTAFANSTNVRAMSGGSQFSPQSQSATTRNEGLSGYTNSLLRQALTAKREEVARQQRQQEAQRQQQQQQQCGSLQHNNMQPQQPCSSLQQLLGQGPHPQPQMPLQQHRLPGPMPPHHMGNPLHPNLYPSDIDLSLYDANPADLDCDMDQIISQELNYGGTLDFDNISTENGPIPEGSLYSSLQPLDSR